LRERQNYFFKYLLKKHIQDNPFIPHTPFKKQVEMIMRPEREVLVGGAAGGSKTDYLCIEALFHFSDPNYQTKKKDTTP